MQKVFRDMEKV